MTVISNTRVLRAQYIPAGGKLTSANFKTETIELDTNLNDGELIIRNIYLSLEPYTGYSFYDIGSQAQPLGQTVTGFGVGEVFLSKNPAFPVKSIVYSITLGWEQYTRLTNTFALHIIPDAHNPKIPLAFYTNVLGASGLTVYGILNTMFEFKKDQVVYISSAAGPVGSILGTFAKRQGAFVIGSAGSDEKVQYLLNDLGYDAAFNYKTKDSRAELDAAAPNGIEVYFDLVSGETLDIALEKMKVDGLIISIGALSAAKGKTTYVTKNLDLILSKSLTIKGFNGFRHLNLVPEFWKEVAPLVEKGELNGPKLTVVKGLENVGDAFAAYMDGQYYGKVAVEVSSDDGRE